VNPQRDRCQQSANVCWSLSKKTLQASEAIAPCYCGAETFGVSGLGRQLPVFDDWTRVVTAVGGLLIFSCGRNINFLERLCKVIRCEGGGHEALKMDRKGESARAKVRRILGDDGCDNKELYDEGCGIKRTLSSPRRVWPLAVLSEVVCTVFSEMKCLGGRRMPLCGRTGQLELLLELTGLASTPTPSECTQCWRSSTPW